VTLCLSLFFSQTVVLNGPLKIRHPIIIECCVVAVLTDRANSVELTVFLGAVELEVVLGVDRRELLRTLSDPSELAGWMNVWIQRLPSLSLLATIEALNHPALGEISDPTFPRHTLPSRHPA
jgi:hypothetical protein